MTADFVGGHLVADDIAIEGKKFISKTLAITFLMSLPMAATTVPRPTHKMLTRKRSL